MEAKLTTSNTSRVVDVDESLEEDERTVEGRGEKSRGKGGREEQGAGEG